MRCVFQDDSFCKFPLQSAALFIQFRKDPCFLDRVADDADENVTLTKIGRDVDGMNGDQNLSAEVQFARYNFAQFPLDHLVYALDSMFHSRLEGYW
jgi:hypothetical protein